MFGSNQIAEGEAKHAGILPQEIYPEL